MVSVEKIKLIKFDWKALRFQQLNLIQNRFKILVWSVILFPIIYLFILPVHQTDRKTSASGEKQTNQQQFCDRCTCHRDRFKNIDKMPGRGLLKDTNAQRSIRPGWKATNVGPSHSNGTEQRYGTNRSARTEYSVLENQPTKDLLLKERVPLECQGFEYLWNLFVKSGEQTDILKVILSRIADHQHVDVGLLKPEIFQTFARIIGSGDIKLRCLACSALNLLLRRDVQADDYLRILLKKDPVWTKIMCSTLRLEKLEHCNEMLRRQLLSEMCSLISILCVGNYSNCSLLVQEGVADCVINLCKPDSLLFGFTEENRNNITNEIVHKRLKTRMKLIDHEKSGTKYELHDVHCIEGDSVIHLRECIAKSGFLWEDSVEQLAAVRQGFSAKTADTNNTSEWREIRISAVINSSEVYSHIDKVSFEAVEEISETLLAYLKGSPVMLPGPPDKNTYVILCNADIPFRCQVKDVNGDIVTVFAFDYGFTKETHFSNLCWLRPGILKKRVTKQAVHCKLKGFKNGVISAKTMGLCLSILMNISKERSLRDSSFLTDDVIETLVYLVLCPVAGLVRHSMRVLLNLSHETTIMKKLCSLNYMDVLLKKLKTLENYRTKGIATEILDVTLESLSNMVHQNPAQQDKFMSSSGLKLVFGLIDRTTNEYTYEAVGQLISNFVGNQTIRDVVEYEANTRLRSLADVPSIERAFSVLVAPMNRPIHQRSRSKDKSRSRSRGRSSHTENEPDTGYDAALTQDKLDATDSSSEEQGNNDSFIDNQGIGCANLVKGHRIRGDPKRCEYFPAVKAEEIELVDATKVVVGFLNAGIIGRIYAGIFNNKVIGIPVTRDQKDQLRQGVDVMMKDRVEPVVHCNQYDINFHRIENEIYVIEIEVRPAACKPLTCFRAQIHGNPVRNYFLRNLQTGETEKLSAQMVHTRTIEAKEKEYLIELRALEYELSRLKEVQTQ